MLLFWFVRHLSLLVSSAAACSLRTPLSCGLLCLLFCCGCFQVNTLLDTVFWLGCSHGRIVVFAVCLVGVCCWLAVMVAGVMTWIFGV